MCGATARRTAITTEEPPPVDSGAGSTDPLIEPFALLHLNYREAIAKTVAPLTDDELNQVLVLFHHQSLRDIPYEFWPVAGRVRAAIQREQARREARQAAETAPTGEPTE